MSGETILARDLHPRYTIESGQPLTFYADYNPEISIITYPVGNTAVEARFKQGLSSTSISARRSDGKSAVGEIMSRFRLGDDIESMYDSIKTDRKISTAIEKYRGMRITKNDPWETTICFIVSQFNNLKRIRKIIKGMMVSFGEEIEGFGGETIHTFPSAEALADARLEEIIKCGTGFRGKYIKSAAEYCSKNIELGSLSKLGYTELKEELLLIDGVGDKVADCIALMGYGKLEAFPIDVWVKRSMELMYFKGEKRSIKDIHAYADKKWGSLAGFAQQYIFWYGRGTF